MSASSRKPSRFVIDITGGSTQKPVEMSLRDWMIADWKSSGISDEMIAANTAAVEGNSAIEILSEYAIAHSQSVQYVTKSAKAILKRYELAALGGWVAYGSTIGGGQGEIAYLKSRYPRIDFENPKKRIKYETPAKCEALPLLPFVDPATAEKIYEKYSVVPLEGESFWSVVRRCNLPIFIAEGLKKAVLLTQQGYPAICLRGVANWHSKGERTLFPILQEFATEGREICIVFDQDTKPKTIANVGCQIKQLGQILQNLGCKVSVTTWNGSDGKGIDDAFVNKGAEWLDQTIATSLSLDEWQKLGLKRQYLELIHRLKTLSIKPDRDTTGDYLPSLPAEIPIGSITLIDANMGSGKSYTGINDVVRHWIKNGGNVLRLDPLLSLGAQGATLSNIPHSSDYDLSDPESYAIFCHDISARHGAAICFNSLHRIPDWFLIDRPLLLVLDEVNQGLDYLIQGGTLGSKQGDVLDRFSEICLLTLVKGAILAAEAGIQPRAVELLKKLSGSENICYFKHYRENAKWEVRVGSGRLDGFMTRFLFEIDESQRYLVCTDSQRSAKKIHHRLAQRFPEKRIVRVDSETNREGLFNKLFDNPDSWLEQVKPDFLIVSPSMKTGVSINWEGFTAVYGFFAGGSINPDGWMQMLGRYRPPVPRIVCVPHFVQTQGYQSLLSPRRVSQKLQSNRQGYLNHFAIEALSEVDPVRASTLNGAQEYYAEMVTLDGAEFAICKEYLISALTQAGHKVETKDFVNDLSEASVLKQIQIAIDFEDAEQIARLEAYETVDKAKKILASECSRENEIAAEKTLWREAFPGITFNKVEDCFWILTVNRGSLGRGAQMQAAIENLAATKELDRESAKAILTDEFGMAHQLPKSHLRAKLLQMSGVMQFADLGVELSKDDPRCKAIQQWAVTHKQDLRFYFGITVAKEYIDSSGKTKHGVIEVCGKLLKKIGLKLKVIRQVGRRGQQIRIYRTFLDRVDDDMQSVAAEYRKRALTAARERLQQIVTVELPEVESERPHGNLEAVSNIVPLRVVCATEGREFGKSPGSVQAVSQSRSATGGI